MDFQMRSIRHQSQLRPNPSAAGNGFGCHGHSGEAAKRSAERAATGGNVPPNAGSERAARALSSTLTHEFLDGVSQ
jgi:predicted lipid-binding transport protein (Tim44 family)